MLPGRPFNRTGNLLSCTSRQNAEPIPRGSRLRCVAHAQKTHSSTGGMFIIDIILQGFLTPAWRSTSHELPLKKVHFKPKTGLLADLCFHSNFSGTFFLGGKDAKGEKKSVCVRTPTRGHAHQCRFSGLVCEPRPCVPRQPPRCLQEQGRRKVCCFFAWAALHLIVSDNDSIT